MSHKLYDDFIIKMSYLIASASTQMYDEVKPLTIDMTITSLNKLFETNDVGYVYNLWIHDSKFFCKKFLQKYWCYDGLYDVQIDIEKLAYLSFPVRQYIALSISNIKNRNHQHGMIYDIDSVQFTNLDELIELFDFNSNLPEVGYEKIITNIIGNDILSDIPCRSYEEFKNDQETDKKIYNW